MSRWSKQTYLALFLAALCGCSTEVTVRDPTIPDPLIAALPMFVGARYPEVFDHFVHEERVIGKEKWLIDLGASNKLLFDKLFGSMFSDYQVIGPEEDAMNYGFDALIEPSIDAFEFSVPEQSQTDAFAVWIRYRIKIFDKQGTQIANWPISAYGKSQTTTFGGDEALRRAAVLAMRDAAALIIMQMDKTTGISSLGNKNSSTAPAEDPAIQTSAVEEADDDSGSLANMNSSTAPAEDPAIQTSAVEEPDDDSGSLANMNSSTAPAEDPAIQTSAVEEADDDSG